MEIVRDLPTLRDKLSGLGPVALVATMGALHRGHLSLLAAARREARRVAASIFVNPLQFGPSEDFSRYPREEAADLEMLRAEGCDIAWLPSVAAMYPPGHATCIEVAGPAEGFEGAARPGHFRGVATVCTKLFAQTGAVAAMFGEKDWQQVQVIGRVVRDLDLPIRIVTCPTVREADGLAMSSRNRFLDGAARARAAVLPASMREAIGAIAAGDDAGEALARARMKLEQAGMAIDYIALVHPHSMQPAIQPPWRLIAAVRIGGVRLLDTMAVP
jgi:pantoate--beta-alanine ligase